ncbi:TPA: DUF1353 domain-containing protein [Stenotrophomonas maltophilia]|uniref:DUF1353 domain-containing protein n=1 Tax=Stenotrophomonas maltophilia TaxID=40324 RepID=UPI001AAF9B4D|nr:DUF1353 domain-containing protein [Stenotrophomonas maltophilia]MBN5121051.1 DUF1353 domain-containing protein [Stenotrophomonas maltophilia]MBO3002864.1 DUF1353 domain-containing protein [Stenotrophomonas maltophilia]MBP1381319.1 DUF1353 domain-containing protein [Stenotrophomonas maltophilia]MBP1385563.1 DUF1353 domain-containing protein [Stenotrophomonas maltophilia]HEL4106446.1 DUF1353 domain-containing protein [Stenotrophomonas maltophilia]
MNRTIALMCRLALLPTVLGLSACSHWIGMPTVAPPAATTTEFADGRFWLQEKDMNYRIGDTQEVITVPSGFVHDGASIPRILHIAIPKTGWYGRAAIIHDYLYWSQLCTREQADNLMLIAMKESTVSTIDRIAIHMAVRKGGEGAWEENARLKATGMPRLIPSAYRDLPLNITWPVYQQRLYELGVRDPAAAPAATPAYCAIGSSTHVPGG